MPSFGEFSVEFQNLLFYYTCNAGRSGEYWHTDAHTHVHLWYECAWLKLRSSVHILHFSKYSSCLLLLNLATEEFEKVAKERLESP